MNRRQLLKGAMGVSLSLPYLEALAPRQARAQASSANPSRLVVFLHHQGTIMRDWRPTGGTTDFTLGRISAPLAPYQSRLVMVDGVSNLVRYVNTQSDGHSSSARTLMTCQPYSGTLDANGDVLPDAQQPVDDHAAGPSIDQVVASRIRDAEPFASMDLAIGTEGDPAHTFTGRVLYAAKDDPVTAMAHPADAFDRVFSGVNQDAQPDSAAERLRARKLSVLDAVLEDFTTLRAELGPSDRQRLDAHADKVREIEKRLASSQTPSVGCNPPNLALPSGYDHVYQDNVTGPLMMDLGVIALACAQTKVVTLHYGTGDGPWFPWITDPSPLIPTDKYDRWHTMVHDGRDRSDLGGDDEPGLVAGYRWYAEQFAALLDRLDQQQDAQGSLLDSTLVLWLSDFGDGYGHETYELPVVLAGATGGATGRYLDLRGQNLSTNQLMVTVLNAFGFDDMEFGMPGHGSGPLPGVLS